MNRVLEEDLISIINDKTIDWKLLKDKSVLISGATGLIGSLLVKTLLLLNRNRNSRIHIIALVRNIEKAYSIFGDENIEYLVSDITDPIPNDLKVDYIFHCASVTNSLTMVSKPVETFMSSVIGTNNLLEFAKLSNIKSMVYVSSMEVYGITDEKKEIITEEDVGFINHLSVRSSYSEGKRACELLCSSYFHEFKVPVKMARLSQTFGAGVSSEDTRVFSQFARSVVEESNITLHTQGNSVGNYCYTADTIRGLFYILTKGSNGEAYTIVNEETTMCIRDMAELVASEVAKGKITVEFDIPSTDKYGYAPDVTMHLSSQRLRCLGWKPSLNLKNMYERLLRYWNLEESR